jgi:hypothetical protein
MFFVKIGSFFNYFVWSPGGPLVVGPLAWIALENALTHVGTASSFFVAALAACIWLFWKK